MADGDDDIEDLELTVLKLKVDADEYKRAAAKLKDSAVYHIETTYQKAIKKNDVEMIGGLCTTEMRRIAVQELLSHDEEFKNLIKKISDYDISIAMGEIKIERLKRKYETTLPFIQAAAKHKAEELLKDGKPLPGNIIMADVRGSYDEVTDALINMKIDLEKRHRAKDKKNVDTQVESAEDVQYT